MRTFWAVTVVGALSLLVVGAALAAPGAATTQLAARALPVAALQQVAPEDSGFAKAYRRVVLREIVWFDDREGDLEKHAFRDHGQIYMTLNDLVRHIGGNIIWGPDASYIQVERGGVKVRVFGGSARVLVDGEKQSLGAPAIRIEGRTFVPVRAMLRVLGVGSTWNPSTGRLYVEVSSR